MSIILGNDLIIMADGTAIAAAKSCNIETTASTIETSQPHDGEYRTFLVARKSWKVTVSVLVTCNNDFLLSVGDTYTLTFGSRTDTGDRLTGSAICTHCKLTATKFNIAQGSFEFQGTGPLFVADEDSSD